MSWRIALGLFAVGLLTRLPLRTDLLYEHDSVLYARAMESFDPAQQRPHPPGYLWYVSLARAVNTFTGGANDALTLISAVAGAAAIALIYALGARLYDERTGRIAAVFLLTSVAFWARGIVAYPYTLLAALTLLIALLLWRANDATVTRAIRERRLVLACAVWGVSVGFRPDLALFIAPLWLLTVLLAKPRLAMAAFSAAAAAAGGALWLLTSGAATPGGLQAFLATLRTQGEFVGEHLSPATADRAEVADNVRATARFVGRALYFLAPLVLVFAFSPELRRLRTDPRVPFLLIWTLAPLPLYVIVHVGEYGHVFTMVPGLVILASRAIIQVADRLRSRLPLRTLVTAAATANAAVFLLTDTPLSAADIARHDRGIAEKSSWLRANVSARDSAIVTAHEKVLIEHYVGTDYRIIEYPLISDPARDRAPVCSGPVPSPAAPACPRLLVLWDDLFAHDETWRVVSFASGSMLRLAEEPDASGLRLRQRRIRPQPGR